MSRPIRIEYPGALYHITARGNERREIFRKEADYKKFLQIIKEAKRRYKLIIYGYVLMSNHYHLLMETPFGNLVKAMHDIQTRYSVYFNWTYKRTGHLFQGRYRALIVDKDSYLLWLSRYIHLNPVKAEIVREAGAYRWSSYKEYIGQRESGIIERRFILGQFGQDEKEAMKRYGEFCLVPEEGDINSLIYGQFVIGSKEFTDRVKRIVEKKAKIIDQEVAMRRKFGIRKSKEKIIEEVSRYYQETPNNLLRKRCRGRKVAMYLIRKHTDMSVKQIGEMFGGIHYTAVSKSMGRLKVNMEKDVRLKKEMGVIEERL